MKSKVMKKIYPEIHTRKKENDEDGSYKKIL